MLLKDKVALITGAGRGIGKAISLRFAEEGASLILCARTASQVQEVTDAIRRIGRPCRGSVVDVAKEEEVGRLVKDGVSKFAQIDILVNNAGISNPVRTELFDSSRVKDFLLKNPTALLTMEDVTGAALYLASDLSGGMNSQTICVRRSSRW